VHEVVGDSHPFHGRAEGLRPQDVAGDRVHPADPVAALKAERVAHENAHTSAGVEEPGHESAADVAGGAGDQDERVVRSRSGQEPSLRVTVRFEDVP
jgi:hypothetical protein